MSKTYRFVVELKMPDRISRDQAKHELSTCISFGTPKIWDYPADAGDAEAELEAQHIRSVLQEIGATIEVPEPSVIRRHQMMPRKFKHFDLGEDDIDGTLVKIDAIKNYIAGFLDVPADEVYVSDKDYSWSARCLEGEWYVDGMTLDIKVKD